MPRRDDLASSSVVRPRLLTLAAVFSRYANLTWGGGTATTTTLHGQIVTKRRWLSQVQFDLAFALSRLTPGTNLLAFCTAAGWFSRGWTGAMVALLASSLPCSLLVVLVTHFYSVWQHNAAVLAALRGALAAAVALVVYTAWDLARSHLKADPVRAAVLVPGAILLATVGQLSPVTVLLLAAVLGALWPANREEPK